MFIFPVNILKILDYILDSRYKLSTFSKNSKRNLLWIQTSWSSKTKRFITKSQKSMYNNLNF